MNRYLAGSALSLLLLFLLTGCAAVNTVPLRHLEPVQGFPYTGVVLDFDENVAEDVSQEATDLEFEVLKRLKDIPEIKEVRLAKPGETNDGALVVHVSVEGIRKVSGFSRFMLGAFAGAAHMITNVSFVEGGTEKVLGEYQIKGESGSSGFAGGTSDAVKKTTEGIVDIICVAFGIDKPIEFSDPEEKREEFNEFGVR